MDANELGRWTRFAAKGGIGKCTATQDCVAEEAEDLMFLKHDEIVVLMQLPGQEDMYLGYCEGVVGRFRGADVHFHSRLKRPVMTKRSSRSLSRSSSRPSSSQSAAAPPIALSRESLSAMAQRASPSLPSAPSRMSYSYSATSLSVTEDSSASTVSSPLHQYASPPLPASPHLPAPQPFNEENHHLRSASHSSGSTALDSAPRTPADFGKDEHSGLVRIVSLSRQVDSPTDLNEDTILQREMPMDERKHPEPELRRNSSEKTLPVRRSPSLSSVKKRSLDKQEPESPSWLDSSDDVSSRVSIALSDGEVGIGLSLLNDFVGADGDDASSTHSARDDGPSLEPNDAESHDATEDSTITESGHADPPVRQSAVVSERSSVYSMASHRSAPRAGPPGEPHPPFVSSPSRSSMHPSISDSEYGGEEWEGASDIYDNYRYSRYSVASKASRFSKGSMYTVASGLGLEPPPPVPSDGHRRSLDSLRRERLASATTASSSVEDVRAVLGRTHHDSSSSLASAREGGEGKRVPPPLELSSSRDTAHGAAGSPESSSSPLLHGTFTSPMSSPNQHSPAFLSPVSPSHTTPMYSNVPGGAASALRHRLEQNRDRSITPEATAHPEREPSGKARQSTQPIVVDDPTHELSHEQHSLRTPSDASQSPPPSPSVISEKKRMIETTYYVANQAPPPPYTLVSPVAGASSQATLADSAAPQAEQQPGPTEPPTLRPAHPRRSNDAFVRRSIFLPHPHAPKPAETPSGPMYGRQPPQHAPPSGPQPGSVLHTLHLALAARGDPLRPRPVTIYGLCERELASAIGPVPVRFGLEPLNSVPANWMRPGGEQVGEAVGDGAVVLQEHVGGKVIPRANFFPKAQTPRPRSRSFSGFEHDAAEVIIPQESAPEDGGQPTPIPSLNALAKRSKSAHIPTSNSSPLLQVSAAPSTSATPRQLHKPSPLSLSRNILTAAQGSAPLSPPISPRAPSSPLAQPPMSVSPSPSSPPCSPTAQDFKVPSPNLSLGQASSAIASPVPASPTQPSEPPTARPVLRTVSGSSSGHSTSGPATPVSPSKHRPFHHVLRHSRSSTLSNKPSGSGARDLSPQSRSSMQERRSADADNARLSDVRSLVGSPPPFVSPHLGGSAPLAQTSSLRSKLSLPTLKIRGTERQVQHEERSPTLSITPSDHSEQPTVSVKDLNFELVKPTGQLASISEDPLSSPPLPSPSVRGDAGSSLRAESPALSMLSASSGRTGNAPPAEPVKRTTLSVGAPPKVTDPQEVEAHRQRELRWISMMASVPASQARKNKKVRKLLWEGVPASVRYLVWAHLTDSKAKRMDGLYGKLVRRERVPASASIERDVQRVFASEPPLLDGSLVNLLQAYLSMVPDIHYGRGLTVIAGHLLLHSPEEDAFWTFVSLMDSHLRPYFASHPVQMEVDASLFGKAVEAMEPGLAKKVFIDMAIPPASLCRPWFTALFMEALPSEHAQRVWDIFLFEGVAFLFRVGLAIVQCCKQYVMKTPERDAVLNTLLHPPATYLPGNPDAFLEMAASVKLKDDDVRKQRTKLEAQVKRQTQARAHTAQVTASGVPPSISLPRS